MALFSECTPQCAQNVLDTADIVREAMLRQLPSDPTAYGSVPFRALTYSVTVLLSTVASIA
jgi:hypothetical protein